MQVLQEKFDVVVCGGGLAGFSAALAAARHGARTCLLQDRPVLGGNSSSEVRVTPHGAAAFHAYARETGIVSEALIEERARNHEPITENGWTNSVWDLVLYDMAVRTGNLTLHLNTTVHAVEMSGPTELAAVVARVANAETQLRIAAATFIDCTGDGTVAALSGCGWRTGVEARSDFDEPHAPAEASAGVMGSSLHFKTVDVGRPVPFTSPDWAVSYDDPDFFYKGGRVPKRFSSGYWWIEIGPPWDTIHDNEKIRHELTRHTLGIWDWFKNRDPRAKAETANLALDWIGQVPGKRESRRLNGRLLLTEHNLLDRTVFEDEVAFGGWYVDLHTIGGLLAGTSEPLNARDLDPTSDYGAKTNVGPFGLPLRIMQSAEVNNLLMAGRNVSATHAALGSIRVMSTTATMGQAVGTAAAHAVAAGIPVSEFSADDVRTIQQSLLRDGCFLPNQRNEDPADLALQATVSCSSQDLLYGVGPESAAWLGGLGYWEDHPVYPSAGRLRHRCAQWISLATNPTVERIGVCLVNHASETATIHLRLRGADSIWDYDVDSGTLLASRTFEIPPGGPVWLQWPVDLTVATGLPAGGGYLRLDIAPNPQVEWLVSGAVQPGNVACYEASPGRYRRFGGGNTLSFTVEPPQQAYPPENVLTGVTRPHRCTNLWRSDPRQPLSQWIQLAWPAPRTIGQIQLTFAGHLLREYHAQPPFYRDPQCAKDYRVQAELDGEWVDVARVHGNHTTRRVHDLQPNVTTQRIRVMIDATNGDPAAGIYEIRCYEKPTCTTTSFPSS